jgi:hypothetical protein
MDAIVKYGIGSKLFNEEALKKIRKEIKAGTYKVGPVLLKIEGTLKVGEDYERDSTVSLLNEEMVCLILGYAGISGKVATEAIQKAYEHKMAEAKGKAAGALIEVPALKDAISKGKELFDGLKAVLPKTPCNGPVTGALIATEVKLPESLLTEVAKVA